jgi:hypothetical protein
VDLYGLFRGTVNRNNFYFLILLFTSLHVSPSIDHPQVKIYTVVFLEAYSGSVFRLYSLSLSFYICIYSFCFLLRDRLCGLVGRVLGCRSGGPCPIPGTTRFSEKKKKVVGLERGPLSLVSTTEELLDREVVAPV